MDVNTRNNRKKLPDPLHNPEREIKIGMDQEFYFRDNFVKTSKYEAWNFVPKFLLEEFNPKTKLANCYFLMIACFQCIYTPEVQISNTDGIPTTLIPLTAVVIFDGIFQILEDRARHKADTEANSSPALVLDRTESTFKQVEWHKIAVGDIVKISSRDVVPADVMILGVSEMSSPPRGICYVETKSLDGETNLKMRNALPLTFDALGSSERDEEAKIEIIKKYRGKILMEHPNKILEDFNGVCTIEDGRVNIQHSNILLRGCVLRNTEYIFGIVVNTGHDTKIMMSTTGTPSKTSLLETNAALQIRYIILLLTVLCVVGASGQAVWNNDLQVKVGDYWYLDWDPEPFSAWLIKFFYFFLLQATVIPVSLYVSMTIVRYFQSYFMNIDMEMFYERTKTFALVRTMTLNEELGQISHIFSDKTGTLTCNQMDFRKASIGGISYGEGITEIGKAAWKLQGREIPLSVLEAENRAKMVQKDHVSFFCKQFDIDKNHPEKKQKIDFFYEVLATCHDIIPERTSNGIVLSASNPDDEAIVAAASFFECEFTDRKNDKITLNRGKGRQIQELELLETIKFSSKRKRMSVVVRDCVTQRIMLMTKGADSVIIPKLVIGIQNDSLFADQPAIRESTLKHMQQFSEEGLRCLLISFRYLDKGWFEKWQSDYKKANTSVTQIENMKNGKVNDIEKLHDELERDLMLIGATALEDRLQDGVPQCIEQLANAGINLWMLTGDKEETAINIAIACNLLKPREFMDHVIINSTNCLDEKDAIREFKAEKNTMGSLPRALIVDGSSLIKIMDNKEAKDALLEFTKSCVAVVGCRVSPDQKKEMVSLIKFGVDGVRTLAIGDGANDVAMIQAAHVGVGIKGEEGVQAVNSSDYAIAQFEYLSVLLLKHGRSNYIRMCALVIYMFYKNLFMSIGQFFFSFFNGFSGQKYYTEAGIQMFNVLFTSIPILLLGIYDTDISYATVKEKSHIYIDCVKNCYFSTIRFWFWLLQAIIEGALCGIFPLFVLDNYDSSGCFNTFWSAGLLCLTAVVIVCNFKILVLQHRVNSIHIVLLGASVLSWLAIAAIVQVPVRSSSSSSYVNVFYDWYNILSHTLGQGRFWMGLMLLVFTVVLKDILASFVHREFFSTEDQLLQEQNAQKFSVCCQTMQNSSARGEQELTLIGK